MVSRKRKVSPCKTKSLTSSLVDAVDSCDQLQRWLKLLEASFYELRDISPDSSFSESSLELVISVYLEKTEQLLKATQDALNQARSINQSSSD